MTTALPSTQPGHPNRLAYHDNVLFGPMGLLERIQNLETVLLGFELRLKRMEGRFQSGPAIPNVAGPTTIPNGGVVPPTTAPYFGLAVPQTAGPSIVAPPRPLASMVPVIDKLPRPKPPRAAPSVQSTLKAPATRRSPRKRPGRSTSTNSPSKRPRKEESPPTSSSTQAEPEVASPEVVPETSAGTDLIGCDRCSRWFHLDCAGVPLDDPRVSDPNLPFICNICTSEKGSPNKRILYPIDRTVCGKSDCTRPIEAEDEYAVERIIGRRILRTVQEPNVYAEEFLVKWEDYPTSDALWQKAEEIGTLFKTFLERFEKQAALEGLSSSSGSVALLKEAVKAGWH